jgi:hypothetical protein
MARVLVGETEASVSEELDEVLARVVASKDGIRTSSGKITAPPGWLILTASDTGDPLYVQTAHIGYIREDA